MESRENSPDDATDESTKQKEPEDNLDISKCCHSCESVCKLPIKATPRLKPNDMKLCMQS